MSTQLTKKSTLDIAKPRNSVGTEAAFHFGVVEGTMLLAMSDDSLEMLRQDEEQDFDEDFDKDFDEDSDEDSDEGRDRDSDNIRMGLHGNSGSRKGIAKGALSVSGSSGRRLGATPQANRIYLQWVGRETGEGEIQVDTDNRHTGYCDFEESKLSAKGVFSTLTCLMEMSNSQSSRLQTSRRKSQSHGPVSAQNSTTTKAERGGAAVVFEKVKESFDSVVESVTNP